LYLRRGQYKEALAEYTQVLSARSDSALPHYRAADAYLQMGNFPEATAAAGRAVKIDPRLRKAHYVYGTAPVRLGRNDEGQKELQAYGKQEADAQKEINEHRDIVVSNRGASALVMNGKGEEGITLFRKSIETHPGDVSLRFNLGMALDMLGRTREAAATLQDLLDSGGDDFLVFKSLAHANESLKNEKARQMFSALYVRKIDAALEEELQ